MNCKEFIMKRSENGLVKVLMVGDSAVGKTSLFHLFYAKEVKSNLPPTLGCDYHIVTMQVKEQIVKLFIWDTAG